MSLLVFLNQLWRWKRVRRRQETANKKKCLIFKQGEIQQSHFQLIWTVSFFDMIQQPCHTSSSTSHLKVSNSKMSPHLLAVIFGYSPEEVMFSPLFVWAECISVKLGGRMAHGAKKEPNKFWCESTLSCATMNFLSLSLTLQDQVCFLTFSPVSQGMMLFFKAINKKNSTFRGQTSTSVSNYIFMDSYVVSEEWVGLFQQQMWTSGRVQESLYHFL